jgi:peptide/nickel transport system substrate-binding protein
MSKNTNHRDRGIEIVGQAGGGLAPVGRRRFLQLGIGGAAVAAGSTALAGSGLGGAISSLLAVDNAAAATTDTLVISTATAITSFDPNTIAGLGGQTAWQLCYDTFFDISTPPSLPAAEADLAHFKPIPALVKSYTSSANGLVWHFELQPKAVSLAGNPLTSADVLWSMKRHLALQIYGGIFLNMIGVTSASQFVADGDHAVTMTLTKVIDPSYMLQLIGALIVPIYDSVEVLKHATTSDPWAKTWMANNVAGFGPYSIKSWNPNGTQTVFEARSNYYGKSVIPNVIWSVEPDTSTQLELLLKGDAQVTDQLSPEQIQTVAAHKGTKVTQVATAGAAFMGFNNSQAPYSDKALHQGIAYAIDFETIVKGVWKGTAQTMKSILPPWFQASTDKYWVYEQNLAKAKALLAPYANAGLTLQYDAGIDLHQSLAELIQAGLQAAGMTIKLGGLSTTQYENQENNGTQSWWLDTQSVPVIPNSLYALRLLFLSKPTQILLHYSNPAVDAAVTALGETQSVARQNAMIDAAQKQIMEDLPVIPLAYTGQSVTSVSNLSGFRGHGGNSIRASELYFS